MNKNLHFHLSHYLILILGLCIGLFSFIFFRGEPNTQFLLAFLTSLFYFLWGVFHHAVEGDLHPKVMVEYLVISLLALVLLRGAIYR